MSRFNTENGSPVTVKSVSNQKVKFPSCLTEYFSISTDDYIHSFLESILTELWVFFPYKYKEDQPETALDFLF